MLDEFLGGSGGGQPLRQAQAERLKPRGKFVSARRDILLSMLRGRGRTKMPGAREIRGSAAAHGCKQARLRHKQGVISAYLRHE